MKETEGARTLSGLYRQAANPAEGQKKRSPQAWPCPAWPWKDLKSRGKPGGILPGQTREPSWNGAQSNALGNGGAGRNERALSTVNQGKLPERGSCLLKLGELWHTGNC